MAEFSLPTDISWTRLAASRDMMDLGQGAANNPVKWRSSIAVFYHRPGLDEACAQTITYLKVLVSITGYNDGEELGFVPSDLEWESTPAALKGVYHPCYSALLQVSVLPAEADRPLDEYPFIADFEPKRRELHEAVTQSGELANRSATALNIRKGATTTASTELGWGVRAEVGVKASMFEAEVGASADGRQRGGYEESAIRTIDDSREKRELYAFSTSLTQLYELLNGYHIGTNRAMFMLQARPHMVMNKDKFTFVNGPRRIEGIQEFFLVVSHGKAERFCVDVLLETAHLGATATVPSAMPAASPVPEREEAPGIPASHSATWTDPPPPDDGKTKEFLKDIQLPPGYELNVAKGGGTLQISDYWNDLENNTPPLGSPKYVGYTIYIPQGLEITFKDPTFWRTIKDVRLTMSGSTVTIAVELKGLSRPWDADPGGVNFGGKGNPSKKPHFNADLVLHCTRPKTASPDPTGETTEPSRPMWVTGRSLLGCLPPWAPAPDDVEPGGRRAAPALPRHVHRDDPAEWVAFEDRLPVSPLLSDPRVTAGHRIREANRVGQVVARRHLESVGSPARYPAATVPFAASRYVARLLARALTPDALATPLAELCAESVPKEHASRTLGEVLAATTHAPSRAAAVARGDLIRQALRALPPGAFKK